MAHTEVFALDISSKTGWAIFEDGKLVRYGTLFQEETPLTMGAYPRGFIDFAELVADDILRLLSTSFPLEADVVIEETSTARNSYSQKCLEFIHSAVLRRILPIERFKIYYIRTGVWRSITQSNQNSEEKKLNAKIGRIKRKTGKKLAKIDGKVVGKKTRKHASLRSFYDHFGIELRRKEEDAAEAALLGLSFIKGAPQCDGTVFGGTLKGIK